MLDRNGFKRKNYAEILAEIEIRAKQLFGEDTNLSNKSPIGLLLMIFAWFHAKLYELAEKVYHSGHVADAEGVQLDYLTPAYNTSREPEQSALVVLDFVGTPYHTISEGRRFETESGIDFAATENITLDESGLGSGLFVCLIPGDIGNVDPNEITVQSEPSADIISVTNPEKAFGGRDEETDTELRNRLLSSGASNGSGTVPAILTDVLSVSGVRAANVTVNYTDEVVDGQPPHSNQVFVLGGDGQDVAEAIYKNFTGVQMYGTDSYTVTDIAGNPHEIAYTPATIVDIFSEVSLTTDNTFPSDGADQVKNAIVQLVGGTATDGTVYKGLSMGMDVVRFQVERAIGQVQGVIDAQLTIGKAADTLSAANILIERNEVAQMDADNISVVMNP